MNKFFLLIAIAGIITFGSCQSTEDIVTTIDCDFDTVSVPSAEIDSINNYLTANSITATKDERGFYYIIDTVGSEDRIENCYDFSVDYKVYLFDGSYVDAGTGVTLRASQVIRGFAFGLTQIGKQGKIKLFLPPTLAYGTTGSYPAIGPNEYLIYEITLNSMVKNDSYY